MTKNIHFVKSTTEFLVRTGPNIPVQLLKSKVKGIKFKTKAKLHLEG